MTINRVGFVCDYHCSLIEHISDYPVYEAAPDLLAACQARIDEWHSNSRNFDRKEPESLKLARAAIRKATKV